MDLLVSAGGTRHLPVTNDHPFAGGGQNFVRGLFFFLFWSFGCDNVRGSPELAWTSDPTEHFQLSPLELWDMAIRSREMSGELTNPQQSTYLPDDLSVGAPGPSGSGNCSPQGDSRQIFILCQESLLNTRSALTRVFSKWENSRNWRSWSWLWLTAPATASCAGARRRGGEKTTFSRESNCMSGGWRGSAVHFVRVYIVLDALPLRMEKRKPICLIRPLPLDMCIGFYIKAFNSYIHIWAGAIVSPCDGLRSRMLMLSKGTL